MPLTLCPPPGRRIDVNELTRIDRAAFRGLHELKNLYVSHYIGNACDRVESWLMAARLMYCRFLDGNEFTELHEDLFLDLANLETL